MCSRGLEPVGTVPDLTTLRGSLAPNLYHLHASLSTILTYSFFITHHMKSDLRVGRVNGTLPILYVFLARSGKTIREVTPVRLDDEGAVQPDVDAGRGSATRGVKISFAGSDGEARTLYYFSTNLADDGVKSSKFLKFCETLGPGRQLREERLVPPALGRLLKVRDFLLANSAVMVQDDSGIPLRYYDPKKWDLQPFGRYLGPIGVFPGRYQAKYAVAVQEEPPDRLRHRLPMAFKRVERAGRRKNAGRFRHRSVGPAGAGRTGLRKRRVANGRPRASFRRPPMAVQANIRIAAGLVPLPPVSSCSARKRG